MKDITIVIETFERPKRLKRLIETIRPRFPSIRIFVADDSRRPRRPENVDRFFEMPYDSGVSAGRNLMVNHVKTKYFLLLDDDFLFTDQTDIAGMYRILESSDIDILGGAMGNRRGQWNSIEISNGVLREGRNRNKYGETAGCIVCDKVKNFLMARTSRVREFGGWPEELKIGEHLPFFVRAMGVLKVAYFPGARVDHQRHRNDSPHYMKCRGRALFLRDRYLAREYGIGTVIQPDSGTRGRIVIGLGTGRCGTQSLACLLDQQIGSEVTHEADWRDLPWAGQVEAVNRKFRQFRTRLVEERRRMVGDVGFYYLPYIEHMLARYPNLALVCMQRDRDDTTLSLVRKMRKRHPGLNHGGRRWRASEWDRNYPKFGIADRRVAAEMFWDNYYDFANRLQQEQPVRFWIVDCASLNSRDGQEQLLSFLAVPSGEMVFDVGIHRNKGQSKKNKPRNLIHARSATERQLAVC